MQGVCKTLSCNTDTEVNYLGLYVYGHFALGERERQSAEALQGQVPLLELYEQLVHRDQPFQYSWLAQYAHFQGTRV